MEERLRQALAQRRHAADAIDRYADWYRRFVHFHQLRHPDSMGSAEIDRFLTHLAVQGGEPAARQAEARAALAFLYREVLRRELTPPAIGPVRSPNNPRRDPDRSPSGSAATPGQPPRLLDRAREVLRVRHYAYRTEECYVQWIERYIRFHNLRHPLELGAAHIEQFLTHLAVRGQVSASTQTQALNALLFLYQQVLEVELPLINAVRARRSRRLPVVLSRAEVRQVLDRVTGCHGLYALMARLLYGAGLRLMECCRLRVKDVDLARGQLLVRQGKGDKDRVVMLPRALRPAIEKQMQSRREHHQRDLARGIAHVTLPDALARKYPQAVRELGWQYLFASERLSRDARSGQVGRHHVYEGAFQRAVTQAVRQTGLTKRVSCHSFATHLLEMGYDIRTVHHLVVALVALFTLAVTAQAADPAKKAQKAKKAGAVTGQVTDIVKEDGKNTGSITIKTVVKKKEAATAVSEEKKFTITEATKFEKAPAKKKGEKAAKDQPGTPATFADVKKGELVAVVAKGDAAEQVTIMGPGKKSK